MGISQRELARRLGKPASFVNKIEQLERRLDILEFIAIANALEIDPLEMMSTVVAALPSQIQI
jgi:transcriptional regulator with XRE-family HTH domain